MTTAADYIQPAPVVIDWSGLCGLTAFVCMACAETLSGWLYMLAMGVQW